MKKVEAVIKPHKLDEVKSTLRRTGIHGMTVTGVKGFGRQRGHLKVYRGIEDEVRFLPKIKIEVVIPDNLSDSVVESILETARTGEIGDGKIYVSDVNEYYTIRTGGGISPVHAVSKVKRGFLSGLRMGMNFAERPER